MKSMTASNVALNFLTRILRQKYSSLTDLRLNIQNPLFYRKQKQIMAHKDDYDLCFEKFLKQLSKEYFTL